MITNIKIHNFYNIIEVSKAMEPNKCTKKQFMKMFIYVFPMIFQSLMGPIKSKCDIPNGTTQG
jgi:hypothetical protein